MPSPSGEVAARSLCARCRLASGYSGLRTSPTSLQHAITAWWRDKSTFWNKIDELNSQTGVGSICEPSSSMLFL